MLTAPLKWLVQTIAWLPDALRPGVFVAVLILVAWFVFVQRGLPNLWHGVCRLAARTADAIVGLALLPDYVSTMARQRRGEPPTNLVLTTGEAADRVLDGAGALYERHQRDPIAWKPVPWIPCLVAIVVFGLLWIAMVNTPVTSSFRKGLSTAFDQWRDFEDWADVDPSRRAEPGIGWPPRPRVQGFHRDGTTLTVRISCGTSERCYGRLIVRAPSGQRLHVRQVGAPPHSTSRARVTLAPSQAHFHHLRLRVARADPE
jgi:hypothetical protein